MKVKKFSIINYRSLKNISINQFDSTTIFYGDNNAGKSNVLNALELIFKRKQILDQGNLTVPESFYIGDIPDSKNNFYNNETNVPITFNIEIDVELSELTVSPLVSNIFSKDNNYTFSFTGSMTFIEGIGDFSSMKIESILANTVPIYLNTDKVEYFPTVKQTAKDNSELGSAFTALINIFNDCIYIINSDRDMLDVSINEENSSLLSPKTFKKYLYDLYLSPQKFYLFEEINEVFSKPPFSYGSISFSEEPNRNLQLMVKEGGFRLPIKHLGSGVLQSLYIITAILESRKKVILIEELEQNLSPKHQYEILNKIQSMITDPSLPLDQLIISSHSAVYDKPRLGDIYFLIKETGITTVRSITKRTIKDKKTTNPVRTDKTSNDTNNRDKDFDAYLAPNKMEWTEEDMINLMRKEHDFEPFGTTPATNIRKEPQIKKGERSDKDSSINFHEIIKSSVKAKPTPKKPNPPLE